MKFGKTEDSEDLRIGSVGLTITVLLKITDVHSYLLFLSRIQWVVLCLKR